MDQTVQPRGLGALLQITTDKQTQTQEQAQNQKQPLEFSRVDINTVRANKNQPRKQFRQEALDELSDSIKEKGLLQPLVVRKLKDIEIDGAVKYEIIAGERRWRASQIAQLAEVPILIKDVDGPADILLLSLIENLQRDDLNPIEEAQAFISLKQSCSLTQEQISQAVSKSRPYVANSMRLLDLPPSILELIRNGELSVGHAKVLLGVIEQKDRLSLGARCAAEGLTVRQLQNLINLNVGKKKAEVEDIPVKKTYITQIEDRLRQHFGTKVSVVEGSNRGKIVIEFYSVSDFDRITGLMGLR